MKTLYIIFLFSIALLSSNFGYSQCSNFVTQYPSATQSTTSPTLVTVSTVIYGGEYAAYSVTSGQTYQWTTCGDTDFDTQLSLWNTAHTISYGYNDNACGSQSTINWTATFTGEVHVLVSQYNCASNSTSMTVQWACTSCGGGLPPTNQDCRGAIPLCFQTYSNSNSYTGQGNYYNEIPDYSGALSDNNCPGNCLLEGELNDVWYTFTVQNSGTVSFTITPNSSGDDYDWAIYNLTNHTCGDILSNNSAVQASCNFCGIAGATGPTGGDPQTCEYGDPDYCSKYNAALNVTAGQIYVVNVSNFSSTQSGYSITFGGTAQIVDNDNPDLQSITSSPACGQSNVTVRFNENIFCSSVQPGDFNITGPGGVTYTCTSAYSSTCASGGSYDREFQLTVTPALTSGGTYTISLVANSVSDICSKPTGTQSLNFTVSGVVGNVAINNHVSCNGGANGSATASASGGTAPYSYTWSNSATTATVNNLTAGTHYVTISDAVGVCQEVKTVVITQPTTLSVSLSKNNVSCYGGNNGTVSATPSGGTAGYSYAWSNSQTGSSISGLTANTYTVTVTDSRGCTAVNNISVSQPTQLTVTASSTNVSCNGGSNGSVTASPSGGTPNYSYFWTGGSTSATASGLSASTYNVTVTDNNGCTSTSSATVTQPTALTSSVTPTNANCNGGSSGSISVTAGGGTAPYTYSWFPSGQTTQTATGLAAGTYSVTITDNNSCTKTASGTIGQPTAISITPTVTNATCGLSNGSASLTVSGGTSPYTYSWSNGGTGSSISGVPAANYTVTVTDSHSCTAVSSANVNNTGAPTLLVNTTTHNQCYGSASGTISVSASGGTPGYTYTWSNGAGNVSSVSGLIAGTYTATVTDANTCQATASVTITQPAQLASTITASTNPSCFSGSNGSATISVSGGTSPYSYSWQNGQTNATATGLSAGTYAVTITDINSCTMTNSVTLSQPTQLVAVMGSPTSVTCFGLSDGSVTVNASGGTSPYSYLWSNGNTNATNTGLSAQSYTVTVTDNHSCTSTANITINQPPTLLVTIPSSTSVWCNGGNNAQASSSVSGGTSPYTYLWSNGATTSATSGLTATTYTLTVTDNNSCTSTASVTISEPSALTATTNIVANVSCPGGSNGSASVSANGGSPFYSYLWSTGAPTPNANGLVAGTHSVTVTDINSCTAVATVTIGQPNPIVANINPTPATCFGTNTGSISLNPTGGTFPFTYLWSNGATSQSLNNIGIGTYDVTITDQNNCTATSSTSILQPDDVIATATVTDAHCGLSDGSLEISCTGGTAGYTYLWDAQTGNATTTLVSNIPSGTYYVTITDAQNCDYERFFSISDIGAPSVSFINQINNVCFGDSAATVTASISGGITPYVISWSTNETTEQISSLGAGTYYITVADNVGCETITSVQITQPNEVSAQVVSYHPITCYGLSDGSVEINAIGGNPGYTYSWEDSLGTVVSTSTSLNNVTAGEYFLTITDINGCIGLFSGELTQPDTVIVSISETFNPTCYGNSNGFAIATTVGGTLPYSYIWNNPLNTANDTVMALSANIPYTVTVTDNNGCSSVQTVTLTQPSQLVLSASSLNATCSAANGQAQISVSGGTPGYVYLWSTGSTNDTITGLAAGDYMVTIYDQNNCSASQTITVGSQNAGSINVISNISVNCFGGNDGSIEVSMNGGTSPFTFNWQHNPSLTTGSATGLAAGNYSVTITDFNYCVTDTVITITQPVSAIIATFSSATPVVCNGNSDGNIFLNVSGGTPNYTYLWNNGSVQEDLLQVPAGWYYLTITDSHNCTFVTDSVEITQPEPLNITETKTNPNCYGISNGSISLSVYGGTSPYTYSWSNGNSSQSNSNLAAGQYIVTVLDANGCPENEVYVLINPVEINVVGEAGIDENNSGYVNTTVSGGLSPYTYAWSNGSTQANLSQVGGGTYYLTLTDANACVVIDTFKIEIPLVIPNMITPNGDGKNDDFEILNIEAYSDVKIEVFSRWGDVLFSFEGTGLDYKNPDKRWSGNFNGKELPMGSYVYIVNLGEDIEPISGAILIKR